MPLTVTFDLPPEVEKTLRARASDINMAVKETLALELFREGKISHHELSQALGLDRFETDAYLKRHNVFEGSLTMNDLDADRKTLDELLGKGR